MGLYRDETGLLIEVSEDFANARGYTPVSPAEEEDIYAQRGLTQRGDDGIGGAVTAFGSQLLSAGTLGLSDVIASQIMDPSEREDLLATIDAHPYAGGAGTLIGAVGTGIAAPGSFLSKTPSGYLSNLAAREVTTGVARGGIAGYGRTMTAMGAEGALQNAGQYIGHSALADVDVTAEGLGAALGTGYAFGALGGGAALGVMKGTVAARRLFSRTMDGQDAAKAAESSWNLTRQEALDAAETNVAAMQQRADDINAAKMEALRYRNEARAAAREQGLAQKAGPDGETQVSQTSSAVPESGIGVPDTGIEGPMPLVDVDGIPVRKSEGLTTVYKAPEQFDAGGAKAFDESLPKASVEKTALETQLEGTKAKLDAGENFRDVVPGAAVSPQIPPGKPTNPLAKGRQNPPGGHIEQMLEEKALADAKAGIDGADIRSRLKPGEVPKAERLTGRFDPYAEIEAGRLRQNNPVPPQYGPTSRAPFSNLRSEIGKLGKASETLAEIRQARTADLLGSSIAKKEATLLEALEEQKAALEEFKHMAGFGDVSDGIPTPRGKGGLSAAEDAAELKPPRSASTGRHSPKARRSLEILDDAHEEALMIARTSEDPREVGAALQKAEEAEALMERLAGKGDFSGGVPEFLDDVEGAARVFERLERANAKVVDALGDAAHPSATARAKAWKQAEDDAVRKATDRAARAVDDVEYGPKTRKQNLNDARAQLDEVNVQDQEARRALGKAEKDVKAQRKAKKDAERLDAKAGKAASGAPEALGAYELLDLPGMPKVSDLPVVGPLLGAWLKYRTINAALGRKMGRVPASANNRVATLVSRTRDRVAKAVDKSLGALEKGSRSVAKHTPKVAGILSVRIYDDGDEDAKKGAPITELAAVRIRELANYVTTPGAIERDVRRELVGVTDPDIIEAAEKHRRMMMEYLLKNAPQGPQQGMIQTIKWAPSPAQAMSFARRWQAANDPAAALERLAAGDIMTSEISETLRAVYPQILMQAQTRLLQRLAESPTNIPYRMRMQLSLMYQLPLDAALDPANLKISQSVYERKPAAPPPIPGTPAQPAIANPVDISQAYMPAPDRRQ